MVANRKIILIGNYPPDGQESMARFAQMLASGLAEAGIEVTTWKPVVVFGSFHKATIAGIGKWLGYIDKWLIFPMLLRWRSRRKSLKQPGVRFHICDHSNAPYLHSLPIKQTAVTCHDVLAIRGAMGFEDAYCSASGLGKKLQQWILSNLATAERIACVSSLTLQQLTEIAPPGSKVNKDWRVIHNAFNAVFKPIQHDAAKLILSQSGVDVDTPFLLHVGSSLPRKNRKLLLDMLAELGEKYAGKVCFAGEEIDEVLMKHAESLGVKARIFSVIKPGHETLMALYSVCYAFIFPSFSEGFGWPVIEAQACAAPVLSSSVAPMPEVSGGAAIHLNPNDAKSFADAFRSLGDTNTKAQLIKDGLANSRRFNTTDMIKDYLLLHRL